MLSELKEISIKTKLKSIGSTFRKTQTSISIYLLTSVLSYKITVVSIISVTSRPHENQSYNVTVQCILINNDTIILLYMETSWLEEHCAGYLRIFVKRKNYNVTNFWSILSTQKQKYLLSGNYVKRKKLSTYMTKILSSFVLKHSLAF